MCGCHQGRQALPTMYAQADMQTCHEESDLKELAYQPHAASTSRGDVQVCSGACHLNVDHACGLELFSTCMDGACLG